MKKIPLSKGLFAIVDDEDFEFLSQWKWYATKSRSTFYAIRNAPRERGVKRKTISMHRVLMNPEDANAIVDHRNCNGLDNRKQNLRVCTNEENRKNSNKQVNNKTGYKGVSFHNATQKFSAQIQSGGKNMYIGIYSTPEEAAVAYNKAALKHHGEFANINPL